MKSNDESPESRRQRALALLADKGGRALSEVESILGLDDKTYVTQHKLADTLGISENRLKWLLRRKDKNLEAKEEREHKLRADQTRLKPYQSEGLRFSISLPEDWTVDYDGTGSDFSGLDLVRLVEQTESAEKAYARMLAGLRQSSPSLSTFKSFYKLEKRLAYESFFAAVLGMPSDKELERLAEQDLTADEAYQQLMDDPESFLIGFAEFKAQYDHDLAQRLQSAKNSSALSRMQIGLFEASPTHNPDDVHIVIAKLRLEEPLTAFDLYTMDKPPPEDVPWGSRPANGIEIDGMHGEIYYYIPRSDEKPQERKRSFQDVLPPR